LAFHFSFFFSFAYIFLQRFFELEEFDYLLLYLSFCHENVSEMPEDYFEEKEK